MIEVEVVFLLHVSILGNNCWTVRDTDIIFTSYKSLSLEWQGQRVWPVTKIRLLVSEIFQKGCVHIYITGWYNENIEQDSLLVTGQRAWPLY